MEWLHQGCESELSADFPNFGTNNFPFKIPFKKCFKNRLFVALASRSGFGAAISDAIARSSIVFCNSVSADRIVVAASRLLGAAACVILLSCATEDHKSYWNGCIKAAKVNCQQIFSILIVLLKFLLKSASKSSFCRFGVEIRFWSCNSCCNKRLLCVKDFVYKRLAMCKKFLCL